MASLQAERCDRMEVTGRFTVDENHQLHADMEYVRETLVRHGTALIDLRFGTNPREQDSWFSQDVIGIHKNS